MRRQIVLAGLAAHKRTIALTQRGPLNSPEQAGKRLSGARERPFSRPGVGQPGRTHFASGFNFQG